MLLGGFGLNSVESLLQCTDPNLRLRLTSQLNQLNGKFVGTRILDIQRQFGGFFIGKAREL